MVTVARFDDRLTAEYARTLLVSTGAPAKITPRFGKYVLRTKPDYALRAHAELAAEELV